MQAILEDQLFSTINYMEAYFAIFYIFALKLYGESQVEHPMVYRRQNSFTLSADHLQLGCLLTFVIAWLDI